MKETLVNAMAIPFEREESLSKARQDRVSEYPTRLIPENIKSWDQVTEENYNPPSFTAEKVLDKDTINPDYMPLNPKGPTGLSGRGMLYSWGPNLTADAIITQINPNGEFQMISILRANSGEPAIPGGFIDPAEQRKVAAQRELFEEAKVDLNLGEAKLVYVGYVDDPRNTDNAWIETSAFHLHLDPDIEVSPEGGDDASDASWKVVNKDLLRNMYASHSSMVLLAIKDFEKETGLRVLEDGQVVTLSL